MFQFAFERALLPFTLERPPLAVPLFRLPNVRKQLLRFFIAGPFTFYIPFFFFFFASPYWGKVRGNPLCPALSRPFTPISITRQPGNNVPERVRESVGAAHIRKTYEGRPVVQGAERQIFPQP